MNKINKSNPRIKTETPDDDNIPSNFNSEIEEVVDSSSCKCCCVILTVITIGIIIRNIAISNIVLKNLTKISWYLGSHVYRTTFHLIKKDAKIFKVAEVTRSRLDR